MAILASVGWTLRARATDYQGGVAIKRVYSKTWVECRGNRELLPNCVSDGDTIRQNWESLRIGNLDTPEKTSKLACERKMAADAKAATLAMLNGANELTTTLYLDKLTGELIRDKYGRVLADISADGVDLATFLKRSGLARDYDGGTKQPWCSA
jgi:endonuclease YncB( thermonuclease family)